MNRAETFALGAAVGAGMVYLMDPDKGRRRRALLRDQLLHVGHEIDDAARAGTRHVRNRAIGLAHEARAELTEGTVDDRVLEERVRSAVGRKISSLGTLSVRAEAGRVTLAGEVAPTEVQELVRTARSVRGVAHVENELRVDTGATRMPEQQAGRST